MKVKVKIPGVPSDYIKTVKKQKKTDGSWWLVLPEVEEFETDA